MAKSKRLSRVRAKPGQLRLKYGLDSDGERGHVIAHGDGVHRGNGHLMSEIFREMGEPRPWPELLNDRPDRPSFLKELEDRGFDLKTLEITIQMKETPDVQAD